MKKNTIQNSPNLKRKLISRYIAAFLLLAAAVVSRLYVSRSAPAVSCIRFSDTLEVPQEAGIVKNTQTTLSVPTQITKIGGDYFLVDCYHDQILTSTTLDAPLTDWYVLTDQISRGHTIAGDGTVYLADDTENNRILVFEKRNGSFYLTQTFDEIGTRPHYIVYDEDTQRFYALSSMTGEMYLFCRPDESQPAVALEKVFSIPELRDVYVRSFTINDSDIYFVSGNSSILCANKYDLSVLGSWPVPDEIAGMVQLTKIQNYYYITVSTDLSGNQDYATLLRVSDLSKLYSHEWEDIYESFIGGGTPYYISSFDGHYYMTEHRIPGHSVWQFDVTDDTLENIETLFE